MFDTEGFSVDLMVGGRWWWRGWFNTHILSASAVQTLLRNVWEDNHRRGSDTQPGDTMAWSTHELGAGAQQHTHFWWSLRDIWWPKSTLGRSIWLRLHPGNPPQLQQRPWATALLRIAPGLKCSVSDVCLGKMIKGWIWELDLYAPCFLNSTDSLKILPSPF